MYQRLITVQAILIFALALDPPVWPGSFEEAFDEKFVSTNTTAEVNGILYYDGDNNRSRLDRINGELDKFCNSLAPNINTPCQNLVTEGKRYIIFPQKSQCCFCCDSDHGCGILKRDWLDGAEYLGQETIDGQNLNKWNKQGVVGYNYYWATADDNAYPRKIDENGAHITDFNIRSFRNRTLDPALFRVPSYCNSNCSDTSFCGKFRLGNKLLIEWSP